MGLPKAIYSNDTLRENVSERVWIVPDCLSTYRAERQREEYEGHLGRLLAGHRW